MQLRARHRALAFLLAALAHTGLGIALLAAYRGPPPPAPAPPVTISLGALDAGEQAPDAVPELPSVAPPEVDSIEPPPASAAPPQEPPPPIEPRVVPEVPEVPISPPPPPELRAEAPPEVTAREPRRQVRAEPPPPSPEPKQTAQAPTRPATLAPQPSQVATRSEPSPQVLHARARYNDQLRSLMDRQKRYPPRALRRRQQGTVEVRVEVDGSGKLLSYRLERSSGHPLLDEEVLKLVERASPFPTPPETIRQAKLELIVPVDFVLR